MFFKLRNLKKKQYWSRWNRSSWWIQNWCSKVFGQIKKKHQLLNLNLRNLRKNFINPHLETFQPQRFRSKREADSESRKGDFLLGNKCPNCLMETKVISGSHDTKHVLLIFLVIVLLPHKQVYYSTNKSFVLNNSHVIWSFLTKKV